MTLKRTISEVTNDSKSTKKFLTEALKQLHIQEDVSLTSLCMELDSSHLYVGLPEKRNSESIQDKPFLQRNFSQQIFQEVSESCSDENSSDVDLETKAVSIDRLREIFKERTKINTCFSDAECVTKGYGETVRCFKKVGVLLSKLHCGKLPAPFNDIPSSFAWEQLVNLTEPDNWSAYAMLKVTEQFACYLQDNCLQRFYNFILLPRVRDDIAQCKKLNPHLHFALKEALYNPLVFFRGIIFPLCESGTCTKAEARMFSSIIANCSNVSRYSSYYALLHIASLPYSDTRCLFIKVLIRKKHALHCVATDRIVDYFLRFAKDRNTPPIMWHLCLLSFVKVYKNNLSQDQRQGFWDLLKVQKRHFLSVMIREELLNVL